MPSNAFLSEQGTSKQEDNVSSNCNNTSSAPSVMPLSRKRNRRIWSLVSGDGHDFRCNACKRIIKCCSPTNITRHYVNNHPEVLKTEEISIDMTKESIEPISEDNPKDTIMTANDISVSSDTRMNTGKIDWSSPSIRKILEKIASRELTEKMGTDMIAYKTGCQLSQSTVRKRYGTYSLSKKNSAAVAQSSEVNERNKTVAYVASASGEKKKFVKLEGKKNQEQLSVETDSTSPAPPIPRQVRSLRLSRSSIVIPEKDDPSKVRIYRCSAYGRGKQGATCYYRCSKCDSLANNKLKNSGTSTSGRTKRYFAHIKTKDGRIIGNAYPEHLPECKPVPKAVQQLQEIDRACRARIQAGNLTPEAARKLGALVAQKNRELKRHIQDDDTFPDKWKSLPKKYSRLCHQAERLRKQKNRQLLRMMNNEQGDGDTEEDQSGIAHEAEIMSGRFKHPPLIIFEPDGQAARIYRINGKSDKLGIVYYRCSKCDVLCRRHKRMGSAEGMTRATVKVEEDEILENMYPAHHEECEVFTLDMVKNLAENLDRFYFAKDYESIIHDSAKTDLRFADGTLISKNQIPIVNHSAMEHVEDDVVVDISNVANTEEVDDGTWETILNQDVLNIRAEDHEGPIDTTCQRYYEANMALRRDMMRCLEEMRTLRTEMRNMLEERKLQYVEVDDDHYEEIIVDEND
uniref:BED-type domain-containing protein n=1 Tax=Elaeophora elaphi TaxID=1147741 RepID=A0A158Q855_9BILA